MESMNKNIDFVITWVDGNDPVWRKERDHYAALEHKKIDDSRFRDWETLRYWFRGVETFAPWVNHIFFVTCGHLPEWLNTAHPKLRIVKHADFIPAEYLPTFSSSTLEYWLYKIEELSDHFVYFNDDMFLIDHVTPERFFKDGLPCDLGGMTVNIHSGMYGASVLLAKTLINEHFNKWEVVKNSPFKWFNATYLRQSLLNLLCTIIRKDEFVGFVNPHLPYSYLKRTFEEVWANCEEDLTRTSKNKFRNYGNVAPWVLRYWQLASNTFSPYPVQKSGQYYLINDSNISEVTTSILQQKKKIICINDSDEITDFEEAKNRIRSAFEKILPKKSSFEN